MKRCFRMIVSNSYQIAFNAQAGRVIRPAWAWFIVCLYLKGIVCNVFKIICVSLSFLNPQFMVFLQLFVFLKQIKATFIVFKVFAKLACAHVNFVVIRMHLLVFRTFFCRASIIFSHFYYLLLTDIFAAAIGADSGNYIFV